MFWGLALEPGKRYAQEIETSFHISMAALDVKTNSDEPVSVVVEVDKNEFILCNLSKKLALQQSMDLNFMRGDTIAFSVKGKGVVHLTGFIIPDEFDEDMEEGEEEEESDDEEVPQLKPVQLNKPAQEKKRKGEQSAVTQPASKKAKSAALQTNGDDEDSEDESDDEIDLDDSMLSQDADEDSDEDGEEEEGEEEEDSDDEDDDESDSGDEEVPVKVAQKLQQQKPQQQKPQQKTPQKQQQQQKTPQKQQQQQQQQQKTPKEQKKSVNGAATPKEQSAKKGDKQTPKQSPKDNKDAPTTPGNRKTLPGGVIVEDLVVGSGPVANSGRQASVYYIGRMKHNNKKFDENLVGPPFRFRVGKGEVIKGWDIGVQGMKVGGKRRVICPPHMAYGNKGSPPVIPPNSTLVFEVELKGVS